MQQHFKDFHIQWVFILEKALWWGEGFITDSSAGGEMLLKVIGQAKLLQDELFTVLVEEEAALNSLPIS